MFRQRFWKRAAAAAVALAPAVASGQSPVIPVGHCDGPVISSPCLPCQPATPGGHVPSYGVPGTPYMPGTPVPMPGTPATPTAPTAPDTPETPPATDPLTLPPAETLPAATDMATADFSPSFASTLAGAGVGESVGISPGGYIDNAVPVTMFRLEYDSAYGNNRPDRAEFFYAKCGCFGTPDAQGLGQPGVPEQNIDYQTISPYFEYAINPRLSVFLSVPVRFINPTVNPNSSGLSDVWFGAKYAFVYTQCNVLSFQLKAIMPSGDSDKGLGTNNYWIEPGFLYYGRLSERWSAFAEVRDQINLSRSSDFTGNVLRYGVGSAYTAWQGCNFYVAPVVEFVGWTALSGKHFDEGSPTMASSAQGDTIVNGKFGIRVGTGRPGQGAYSTGGSDLYVGYGRALTGEVWYKDIIRVQYRKFF